MSKDSFKFVSFDFEDEGVITPADIEEMRGKGVKFVYVGSRNVSFRTLSISFLSTNMQRQLSAAEQYQDTLNTFQERYERLKLAHDKLLVSFQNEIFQGFQRQALMAVSDGTLHLRDLIQEIVELPKRSASILSMVDESLMAAAGQLWKRTQQDCRDLYDARERRERSMSQSSNSPAKLYVSYSSPVWTEEDEIRMAESGSDRDYLEFKNFDLPLRRDNIIRFHQKAVEADLDLAEQMYTPGFTRHDRYTHLMLHKHSMAEIMDGQERNTRHHYEDWLKKKEWAQRLSNMLRPNSSAEVRITQPPIQATRPLSRASDAANRHRRPSTSIGTRSVDGMGVRIGEEGRASPMVPHDEGVSRRAFPFFEPELDEEEMFGPGGAHTSSRNHYDQRPYSRTSHSPSMTRNVPSYNTDEGRSATVEDIHTLRYDQNEPSLRNEPTQGIRIVPSRSTFRSGEERSSPTYDRSSSRQGGVSWGTNGVGNSQGSRRETGSYTNSARSQWWNLNAKGRT